jgi:hypothetical protein
MKIAQTIPGLDPEANTDTKGRVVRFTPGSVPSKKVKSLGLFDAEVAWSARLGGAPEFTRRDPKMRQVRPALVGAAGVVQQAINACIPLAPPGTLHVIWAKAQDPGKFAVSVIVTPDDSAMPKVRFTKQNITQPGPLTPGKTRRRLAVTMPERERVALKHKAGLLTELVALGNVEKAREIWATVPEGDRFMMTLRGRGTPMLDADVKGWLDG